MVKKKKKKISELTTMQIKFKTKTVFTNYKINNIKLIL